LLIRRDMARLPSCSPRSSNISVPGGRLSAFGQIVDIPAMLSGPASISFFPRLSFEDVASFHIANDGPAIVDVHKLLTALRIRLKTSTWVA
jgi:hypothetical protein